ncbi:MAG TPA: DUF389 domain-containing protein [Anaerolineales bacterium]|nr:DUF389 domain-containing protein [Anaerolineales bacterium]
MNINEPASPPSSEPTDEFISARARRRRAQRRAYFPTDERGRAALFEHLTRRAYPSYELFVFSLVAGAILGAGYFLNSQALLIFGILVAPLMTPWIGLSLATIGGAGRFFAQTFTAFIISSMLIFGCGLLTGVATRAMPDSVRTFTEAFIHSRLWWPDFVTLTIGAIVLTISFVRSEDRPYLPSALVAYEFFLPLCAAGFGLGSGVAEIWPQGLFVFFAHLAWATFFGIITLFFLRFYPTSIAGISFTGIVLIVILGAVIVLTGFDQWIKIQAGLAAPEPAPAVRATSTLALAPTISPSPKVDPATALIGVPTQTPSRIPSLTVESTLPPMDTATSTITAEPTPIIGLIKAAEGGGAFIREKPGGKVLATLGNGATVTIMPNDFQDVNGVIWVHVFAIVNDIRVEGWMIQAVLVTATPIADWQPSPTLEITATP